MADVLAITDWKTNGAMIADVARLGYISQSDSTLDATYGQGTWWTDFQPYVLVAHDLRLDSVDFRSLPHPDNEFDVVAYDPPYKLNGTPSGPADSRYGVDQPMSVRDKMNLIYSGLVECSRVCAPGGILLVKCQDQVVSGAVRWQSFELVSLGAVLNLRLEDMLLFPSYRPQPPGKRQVHARRNYSTLLIFRKAA